MPSRTHHATPLLGRTMTGRAGKRLNEEGARTLQDTARRANRRTLAHVALPRDETVLVIDEHDELAVAVGEWWGRKG